MKRFLVLGIGNAQLDLVLTLKKRFFVVACSDTDQGPAYEHLDSFEPVDITDKEKVLEIARKYKVDYVYSVGSDVAMPTVAWVAEKMGLPKFVAYKESLLYSNKSLFRKYLQGTDGAVPYQLLSANDLQLNNIFFPVIVKPVDSQGQRGVNKVDRQQDLEGAYFNALQHSKTGNVIAEEYIEGIEVSVNAFISAGEVVFSLVSDRISWPGYGGGLIHKHILPSSVSAAAKLNIDKMIAEVVATLSVDDGPLYFQIKLRGNQPYLIEVAARLDGCHMWRLIKFSLGIDLLNICIEQLIEKRKLPSLNGGVPKSATLEFFCLPPGTVFQNDLGSNKDAVFKKMYYRSGEKVRKMNGYKEKCGYQIYEH